MALGKDMGEMAGDKIFVSYIQIFEGVSCRNGAKLILYSSPRGELWPVGTYYNKMDFISQVFLLCQQNQMPVNVMKYLVPNILVLGLL